jgi:Na+/proline symporter
MEMLILFGIVVLPIILIGLYAMYKDEQQKREEQKAARI